MQPDARRQRLFTLDLVRGLAALLVCAQHLRTATMVDYPQLAVHNAFDRSFYFITNLGHESVMVFFVLSGFFVGGAVLRKGSGFDWFDYLLARSLRLWCVLVPALLLTFFCDRWLMLNAPGVLSGEYAPLWHSAPLPGAYDASWLTALGNVFFLQTVWVPVYGSNGPLWSLANEAWYYVLFPLLFVAWRGGAVAQRYVSATVAVAMLFVMPASMRWLFGVWVLGVGVHALDRRAFALPRGALPVSATMFVAAVVLSRLRIVPTAWAPLPDGLVGTAFAMFCLALTQADRRLRVPGVLRRAVSWLSDISFSLYLSHFPLVLVIAAVCYREQRMLPDAGGLVAFGAWTALLLAAGYVMWWCFESRTQAVREWIDKWPPAVRAFNE